MPNQRSLLYIMLYFDARMTRPPRKSNPSANPRSIFFYMFSTLFEILYAYIYAKTIQYLMNYLLNKNAIYYLKNIF